jgi:ankyrin repeat protein
MVFMHRLCLLIFVLATGALSNAQAADKKPPINAEALKMIDRLVEVEEFDTGYNPYTSGEGTGFAPLHGSYRKWYPTTLTYRDPPPTQRIFDHSTRTIRSDIFAELVHIGPTAVPDLLRHLDDTRETRLTIRHSGGFGGLFTNEPDTGNRCTHYTMKVADLCYVAIGQIVNRNYNEASYQPSAIFNVFTPTCEPETRAKLIKEWGDITPEKHRALLMKDLENSKDMRSVMGAFKRLGYYYPDAFETPALKLLTDPKYSSSEIYRFISTQLSNAADPAMRRQLFDAYVKIHGEASREGIEQCLYGSLRDLEFLKRIRKESGKEEPAADARQLLIELFNAGEDVKPNDKPTPKFTSIQELSDLIEYSLAYDRNPKIDRAVCDILAKAEDRKLALVCIDRLIGRGYDAEIKEYFRKNEAQFEPDTRKRFQERLDKEVWTPLHVAVWHEEHYRFAELLKEGADVNAVGKDKRTPLHVAVSMGNDRAIPILLAAGAKLDATDAEGRTPVAAASFAGNTSAVRALLQAGSSVSDILVAATSGDALAVSQYLKKDKDAHTVADYFGMTPLHRAAMNGNTEVMKRLLDAGAKVDSSDKAGFTPLHYAAVHDYEEACQLLIGRGTPVDVTDPRIGAQPIHLAADRGNVHIVLLLVSKGAKIEAKTGVGKTPLAFAAENGHLAVVEWLVEQNAEIDAGYRNTHHARHYALQNGHKDVAAFLLKKGAKTSPFDDE